MILRSLTRLFRLVLTLAAFSGVAHATPEANTPKAADPIATVRSLLEARLELMPDVALYKWNHHLEVEDMTRESVLLDAMIARAEREGLGHSYAITFVSAQMEAAKAVQRRLFEAWQFDDSQKPQTERDLKADLRPKIAALTEKLVVAAKAAQDALASCAAQERLRLPPDSLEDDLMAWRIAADGIIASQPCE